jgi:hypothetical protein
MTMALETSGPMVEAVGEQQRETEHTRNKTAMPGLTEDLHIS